MAQFTVGDTSPALTGTCKDGDTPANLTGAAVELHIRWSDATTVTKAADVTDAANGAWSYSWQPADLTIAGRSQVEAQVTFSGGGVQTFGPVTFHVGEQLA
jgi:hypothetical protein